MASIPDVLVAAGAAYSLVLENGRVRVMRIRLKPGEKAPMHNHPNDHVVVVNKDVRLKLVFPDGKEAINDLKAGQVLWLDGGSHEAQNVGTTDHDSFVIEIKK
jgi:hypothetical protein